MVLNRRVFYPNANVPESVSTPIKRPFHPKKRGCPGRFFSPAPHKEHLKICTRSVAGRLTATYCLFFSRPMQVFLPGATHHTFSWQSACASRAHIHNILTHVLSGYFSTISVNWVVRECNTLLRLTRKFFGLNMTRHLFLFQEFLDKGFTHIKSGSYFQNRCITLLICFNYFFTRLARIRFDFFRLSTEYSGRHINGICCIGTSQVNVRPSKSAICRSMLVWWKRRLAIS